MVSTFQKKINFKINFNRKFIAGLLLLLLFISCKSPQTEHLFLQLSPSQSGIHFKNDIDEKKFPKATMNEFGYMGAGVAIGDFDNDGLKDIFFCGNQVSSALYHNNGNNSFSDITKLAGVTTNIWATGATVIDINHDGFEDIYVCTYGNAFGKNGHNLLFINQHNNTFKEESKEYGLDISSYCTQAVFFDYDNDNDLDVYLVNYAFNMRNAANNIVPKDLSGNSIANDQLYRNNGDSASLGHPFFYNITKQAGIVDDGFGLGVSVSDFNGDGWPDIYVSNDFLSNDVLWMNNKNGTFSNTLATSTGHQSYSSMGCDAADINNDGLVDFATVDMMPEDNYRKKLTDFTVSYDRYQAERNMNYTPGFTRNMLQLNVGNIQKKDTAVPIFSEIGQLAGISETDWSWSILFADFNNDGNKDVHITNGIGRNFVNADFSQFTKSFGSSIQDPMEKREGLNKKLVSLDYVNLPNYFYLNNGDYTFSDQSKTAGIDEMSISNGAAYADLDNDGDLDLVVNNINKEPFVFINNTVRPNQKPTAHSIGFVLNGDAPNNLGIGAKVEIFSGGKMQMQEEQPVRGYMSSVDTKLIFGAGKAKLVDSMVIIWPNKKNQILRKLKTDSVYNLYQKDAAATFPAEIKVPNKLFEDVTEALNVNYKHVDIPFYDFGEQLLLPQKYSQLGPFIATADIDNNGTTDFFIGGGFNSYGQLFSQNTKGTFNGKPLYTGIKYREDMNCIFFDADKDGDQDLLVTYGDMRYSDTSTYYNPQLFMNDGKGNFKLSENAIPSSVKTIAGCVTVGDYDGDGDLDVFIGGRVSKKYPNSPNSFILQNNNGIFTDVTNKVCKPLQAGGMITGATWTDFDNDKKLDLVVVGEWMPIRFFKNTGTQLVEVTENTNLKNVNGMWRSLIADDIDNDGDVDFVAGNIGLNCKYHVTATEPMKLFAKDIDNNGKIDPILFYCMKDDKGTKKLFPAIGRDQLAEQLPLIKKQFLKHADFGYATVDDIFKNKENLLEFTCDETASCWFENVGNGKFVKHVLPQEAQFAPINAIICNDMDGDGIKDLLLAGNDYQTEVATGRYDASYGLFLKGDKQKNFRPFSPTATGFFINGDVKDMKLIKSSNNKLVVVGINNQAAKVFKVIN